MTIQKLASKIALREGKKSSVKIGDVREILKIIATMEAEDLVKYGMDNSKAPLRCLGEYANQMAEKMESTKRKKGI